MPSNPETPITIDGDFDISEDEVKDPNSLTIGSGSASLTADEQGLYIGGEDFASAPFSVDLNGNTFIENLTTNGPVIATGLTTDAQITVDNVGFTASMIGGLTTTSAATAPTVPAPNEGDLWLDSSNGYKMYRYTSGSWVSVQDTTIAAASAAASAANTTANGKNKVTYSTSTPGATANAIGDIWWQYSGSAVIAQWTGAGGTSWTSNTLSGAVLSSLDAGSITTGSLAAARIAAGSLDASKITAGTITATQIAASTITTSQIAAGQVWAGTINAANINAGTLTGFTIQSASSGSRVVLNSVGLQLYAGSQTNPGQIDTAVDVLFFRPPSNSSSAAVMNINGANNSSPFQTTIQDGTSARFRVDPTTGVTVAGNAYSLNALKNILATSTTGTPTGGNDGDVVLVYTP